MYCAGLLVLLWLAGCEALLLSTKPGKAFSLQAQRNFHSVGLEHGAKRVCSAGLVALLSVGGPAYAALEEMDTSSSTPQPTAVRVISVSTVTGSASKNSQGSSDDDDLSYKASLVREKKKQEVGSKKSKVERGRDLCEQLGRGC